MSQISNISDHRNIYEEVLNEETILDFSSKGLTNITTIYNSHLNVIYLQNNEVKSLPDDFFVILPNLMYLDLRNNKLTDLPPSIKNHQCLTHLLLQDNKLTSLPNELSTVISLKVLQLSGNPLMYPPREIINAGISSVKSFLHEKYMENLVGSRSDVSEDAVSFNEIYRDNFNQEAVSYNSVIDGDKIRKKDTMTVKFNDKETDTESENEYYSKNKGKCPKLAKSRLINPPYYQSSKYLKPLSTDTKAVQDAKIKQSYLKELALKKHKDLLARRDKILQGRKNLEILKDWRKKYRLNQFNTDGSYKMDPKNCPYGTHAEYMSFLTRDDIVKDLPNKYKKKLIRKSKPSVARKSNNDVHLALKIKQLFENLEAIDLNRKDMTPRTEQKMLMNEIQKITAIKEKLLELSTTNTRSVTVD